VDPTPHIHDAEDGLDVEARRANCVGLLFVVFAMLVVDAPWPPHMYHLPPYGETDWVLIVVAAEHSLHQLVATNLDSMRGEMNGYRLCKRERWRR